MRKINTNWNGFLLSETRNFSASGFPIFSPRMGTDLWGRLHDTHHDYRFQDISTWFPDRNLELIFF